MLDRSLKPGSGSRRGVPPVARTSFVYGKVLPDFVLTDLLSKSMEATSSLAKSIEPSLYHSSGLRYSFDASVIRAFDSFVRSIGIPSLEMTVTWPSNACRRRLSSVPKAPLPLKEHQYQHTR
jgi:hypothetical protein